MTLTHAWHVEYRTSTTSPVRVARFRARDVLDERSHRRAWQFMRGIDDTGGTSSVPLFGALDDDGATSVTPAHNDVTSRDVTNDDEGR